jgi:hypothetical protein
MLPVLVAVAIWCFTHLRRDKQGRLFWYSQIYESRKHDGKIDRLVSNVESISTDILKLTFYNDNLPTAERLCAGLRYIANGGNGEVKHDVIDTVKAVPDIYSAIKITRPELTLEGYK